MAEMNDEEKSKLSASIEKTSRNEQDVQHLFKISSENSSKIVDIHARLTAVEKGLSDLFKDKQSVFLWAMGVIGLIVLGYLGVKS